MKPRRSRRRLRNKCPKCKEPTFDNPKKPCQACQREGGPVVGCRNAFTTQANRLKGDTGLGR